MVDLVESERVFDPRLTCRSVDGSWEPHKPLSGSQCSAVASKCQSSSKADEKLEARNLLKLPVLYRTGIGLGAPDIPDSRAPGDTGRARPASMPAPLLRGHTKQLRTDNVSPQFETLVQHRCTAPLYRYRYGHTDRYPTSGITGILWQQISVSFLGITSKQITAHCHRYEILPPPLPHSRARGLQHHIFPIHGHAGLWLRTENLAQQVYR